ncbi:phosphoadenosine phosphosulfate reductase [Faecalicatena contorta]|uniref:phosphoadenosine phosphosulfate reductase n=1 Tax=Faecalicatena contorta TaxID=39482 RepID=UPI0032161FF5
MKVCWFSCGISSFVACYLAKDIDRIIYTHIENQHPDSLRFLHDCEQILGCEIEILQSEKYKSVDDVIEKTKCINTAYGAPCTKWLKKQVRKDWERENWEHHTYVWGYDTDEKRRADRVMDTMTDFEHEFPLIEHGLSKKECHGIAEKLGLKRPKMYDLGYPNNNCIGCVKGGMGYWNKIRIDFPEVFERRAKQEREIGRSCIKGVFLDELAPDRGKMDIEIMEDCTIACQLLVR